MGYKVIRGQVSSNLEQWLSFVRRVCVCAFLHALTSVHYFCYHKVIGNRFF